MVSVERETFPGLVEDGALVVGYVETAYWRDVGSPEALVAASRDLVLGLAPREALDRLALGRVGGALVDEEAQVAGEVGSGSVVMPHARVEPGALVAGSVVMRGVVVGPGAEVRDSVLGPGAAVGSGARLHGVALGDDARVGDGAVLEGVRVGCGETAGTKLAP